MIIHDTTHFEPHTVTITDPRTGIEWTKDFIGVNSNSGIQWDDARHQYTGTKTNILYWMQAAKDYQAMYNALADLPQDTAERILCEYIDYAHEDRPSYVMAAIRALA